MTDHRLIQREVLINAPLAHVWQLVATEEGLRQWWGNPIFLEAKEGGRCEEWRPSRGDASTFWRGVITLYAPPTQLMLTLRAQDGDLEGEEISTIAIALAAEGDQTCVQVTQRAFGSAQAITSGEHRAPQEQPEWRPSVPLAQLTQPAPGELPMRHPSPLPSSGRIEPSLLVVTSTTVDEFAQRWQARFTALSAAALQMYS